MVLYIMRESELKADEFSVDAGFGRGLLSFLEKTKNLDFSEPSSVFKQFYATHPTILIRIGKIENRIQGLRA